jgi:hypothetical protein
MSLPTRGRLVRQLPQHSARRSAGIRRSWGRAYRYHETPKCEALLIGTLTFSVTCRPLLLRRRRKNALSAIRSGPFSDAIAGCRATANNADAAGVCRVPESRDAHIIACQDDAALTSGAAPHPYRASVAVTGSAMQPALASAVTQALYHNFASHALGLCALESGWTVHTGEAN